MHRITQKIVLLSATLLALWGCQSSVEVDELSEYYENVPFETEPVVRPIFPDYSVDITDFGAVGDGIIMM